MGSITSKKLYELTGLSTDAKPIPEDICTGSTYFEIDSGLTFVYNEDFGTWMLDPHKKPTPGCPRPDGHHPEKIKKDPYLTVGILSVEKVGSEKNVDFYSINFSNGSSTIFSVTNGKDVNINIPDNDGFVIPDKLYSLQDSADGKSYFIDKLLVLNGTEDLDIIETSPIENTKFWYNDNFSETKFVVKLENDTKLVFNLVRNDSVSNDLLNAEWTCSIYENGVDNHPVLTNYFGKFYTVNTDYVFRAVKAQYNLLTDEDLAETIEEVSERIAEEVKTQLRAIAEEVVAVERDARYIQVNNLRTYVDGLLTDLNNAQLEVIPNAVLDAIFPPLNAQQEPIEEPTVIDEPTNILDEGE